MESEAFVLVGCLAVLSAAIDVLLRAGSVAGRGKRRKRFHDDPDRK